MRHTQTRKITKPDLVGKSFTLQTQMGQRFYGTVGSITVDDTGLVAIQYTDGSTICTVWDWGRWELHAEDYTMVISTTSGGTLKVHHWPNRR